MNSSDGGREGGGGVGFFPAFRINIFEYPRYYKLGISLYVCTFSKPVHDIFFERLKLNY